MGNKAPKAKASVPTKTTSKPKPSGPPAELATINATTSTLDYKFIETKATQNKPGEFAALPPEIMSLITDYLPLRDMVSLGQTCAHMLNLVVNKDTFWLALVEHTKKKRATLKKEFDTKVPQYGRVQRETEPGEPEPAEKPREEARRQLLRLNVATTCAEVAHDEHKTKMFSTGSATRISSVVSVRTFDWPEPNASTELINGVFANAPIYQKPDPMHTGGGYSSNEDAFTWDFILLQELEAVTSMEQLDGLFAKQANVKKKRHKDKTVPIKVPTASDFMAAVGDWLGASKVQVWRDAKFTSTGHSGEVFVVTGQNNKGCILQYEVYSSYCAGLYERNVDCGMG